MYIYYTILITKYYIRSVYTIVLCDNGTWVKVAHSSSQLYESGFLCTSIIVTEFYIVPSRHYNGRFARYIHLNFLMKCIAKIFSSLWLSPYSLLILLLQVYCIFSVHSWRFFVLIRRSRRTLHSRHKYIDPELFF